MTAPSYRLGSKVRLIAQFTVGGTPADPDTVVCRVMEPGGTVSTLSTVVKDSTGNYHADLDIPSSAASVGGWQYRFEGTGSVADADEGQFDVRESDFYA